nr:proline-rich receptor-like protein kinase PERK2 [Aegilops tauschii subsp. strangulata]
MGLGPSHPNRPSPWLYPPKGNETLASTRTTPPPRSIPTPPTFPSLLPSPPNRIWIGAVAPAPSNVAPASSQAPPLDWIGEGPNPAPPCAANAGAASLPPCSATLSAPLHRLSLADANVPRRPPPLPCSQVSATVPLRPLSPWVATVTTVPARSLRAPAAPVACSPRPSPRRSRPDSEPTPRLRCALTHRRPASPGSAAPALRGLATPSPPMPDPACTAASTRAPRARASTRGRSPRSSTVSRPSTVWPRRRLSSSALPAGQRQPLLLWPRPRAWACAHAGYARTLGGSALFRPPR